MVSLGNPSITQMHFCLFQVWSCFTHSSVSHHWISSGIISLQLCQKEMEMVHNTNQKPQHPARSGKEGF